jgi:hypothetical protein
MDEKRTLPTLLADLEGQVERLRQGVALHTQQEEHHREQKKILAERLAALDERLGRFREAAAAVLELAEPPAATAAPSPIEDFGSASKPKLSRMVDHVLAQRLDATPFGAAEISREVNRHFGQRLRHATDAGQISVFLRRYRDDGRLRMARKGRSYSEALYARP